MNAATIAAALGRHAHKAGGGFMACCPAHADKNPSLAVDDTDGGLLVKCFAGCEQSAVVEALKVRNLWPGNRNILQPVRQAPAKPIWRAFVPVPADAPPPPAAHPQHGKSSMSWRYLSSDGDLLQVVCRFDGPDGKQVLPLTYCTDGTRHAWRWQGLPEPRPLYGLELIGNSAHVVVCEGEKATDAARRLLGDKLPVVTWPGGSNAVAKADWSPLAGKVAAVWPDADGPGTKAALAIADALAKIDSTLKIVDPPDGVAKGWDVADAEVEGWTGPQVRDYLKAALSVTEFKAKYHQGAGVEERHDAPLLFDETATPEISPNLLPGWLGEYVDAVARSTQTPPAMAVMLALSTVATCTSKRFDVEADHVEPLNLWTAAVLPPANRKTAVISAITVPLVNYEKDEADRLAPTIKATAIRRRLIEKRIDQLEKKAGKADSATDREALQKQIADLQDEMPPEVLAPRLWTGDITPERLQGLLVDHGERMAVLTDEGGIFEVMAGLYNDGRANLDIFLKAHAGSAARVDRQGRTAHLDAPALSFGLAIQPAILADMGSGGKRRFRGNGTLARFLYVVPASNVGSRDVRAVYRVPATVAARYQAGLLGLLAIPPELIDGREVPRRLTLTSAAIDSWYAFAEMIEQRQGPDGDLESISDWSGKLPGAALRIAGNLHLVEYGANPPAQIDVAIMERALDLCTLLIDHAKAAFAMLDADPATADAKAVFKWIEAGRLARFKRGDLWPKFKGRFTGRTERLDKALKELERRHIVNAYDEETRGRTATVYTVNPALW